jgi:hypothetical protein
MVQFFESYDAAKAAVISKAREFIDEEVMQVVTKDFGGDESDDFVCQEMQATANKLAPVSRFSFKFDDEEEGEGCFDLKCYNHEGTRFALEYLNEGGPSEVGSVCFVTQKTYYEIAA